MDKDQWIHNAVNEFFERSDGWHNKTLLHNIVERHYNAAHPPPPPEPFKVPVVEIGDSPIFHNGQKITVNGIPMGGYDGDNVRVGIWLAIAHTCKMASRARELYTEGKFLNTEASRDFAKRFDAGPVKIKEGETQAG